MILSISFLLRIALWISFFDNREIHNLGKTSPG